MAQSGSTAAGTVGAFNQNFQGQAAANQAAYDQTLSAENRWSAAWTPSDRFSLSYSSYESQQLDDDRTLAQVLSGDNTLSAKWTAGAPNIRPDRKPVPGLSPSTVTLRLTDRTGPATL